MKFSRDGIISAVMILLVLICFNTVVFSALLVRNGLFWVSYAFTTLSFVLQPCVINYISLRGGKKVKSRVYGLPIINVSLIYLILQYPLGAVAMIMSFILPFWIMFAVYLVLFALAFVGLIPQKEKSRSKN